MTSKKYDVDVNNVAPFRCVGIVDLENHDEYGCNIGNGISVFGENIVDDGFVGDGGDGVIVVFGVVGGDGGDANG